jgi:hypothetical protein
MRRRRRALPMAASYEVRLPLPVEPTRSSSWERS